jgi:alpha-beta hydrolase superfamily lysophospholipase
MRVVQSFVVWGLLALGCSGKEQPTPAPSAAPSASAVVAAPPEPVVPPTVSEAVTFAASDKIPLSGTLYLAADPAAPVLVFVHRFRGDRQEWAPFAARLAAAAHRYTIVNFDLRGHGDSKSAAAKKRLDWADMKDKDIPSLVKDVHAALEYGFSRGKATRGVVVGSSLGAALAARAASEEARIVAVGLVSPGAAIQSYDVYHPFADARTLPSFIAGAKNDNVSREPIENLSRMAKEQGTVKIYEGTGHGAFGLAQEGDQLFQDLQNWLMTVFDDEPVKRDITPTPDAAKKERKG